MNRSYQPIRIQALNLWQVAVDNAHTRSKTATAVALLLCTALMSHSALAQFWNFGNVGDWEDGTNWMSGSPPAPGEQPDINEGHATLSSDVGEMFYLHLASSDNQGKLTLDGPNAALALEYGAMLGWRGDATLEVRDGALFSSQDSMNVGGSGGGAHIILSGSAGRRGTLEVREIDRSTNSSGAFLTFDGGVLRVVSSIGFFDPDILEGWAEDITLNAGGGFIDSNGYNISLSETLTGAGGLTKLGAGTLSLEGSNTYSGGTVIEAGTLQIGAGGTSGGLGSGDITNNASLVFNRSDELTVSNLITGSGSVNQAGSGTTVLTGANTYTGGTTVHKGTLAVDGGSISHYSADILVSTQGGDNGALIITGGGAVNSDGAIIGDAAGSQGAVTVSGTGSLWETDSFMTVGKSGSGTLTIAEGGTVDISDFGSSNSVLLMADAAGSSGTLSIGNGGGAGILDVSRIRGTGTLNFNHTDAGHVFSSDGTASGVGVMINGPTVVNHNGTGTTILIRDNTYSGGTVIEAGTLQIGAGGTLQYGFGGTNGGLGTGAVTINATLVFNRSDDFTVGNSMAGSGLLNQTGSGTLILTNDNTSLTGAVTIDAGTLQVGAGGTSGGLGSGEVTNNTTLVFNRSDEITVGNPVSGSGSVNQSGSGTVILTNDNASLTGAVTIESGTLQVGAGGTSGGLGSGEVTNNTSLVFNRSDELTVNNAITGSGSVMHTGSGTTTLTGANTYSGDTTVSAGTLVVNSSITSAVTVQAGGTLGGSGSVGGVTNAGTLAPGNTPETLTIAGDLMLNTTSVLDFELDTPDVVGGGVNDLIEVNGNLTLDGTLDIIDWGNYGAGIYRLINYTGTFTDNGLDIGTQPAGFNAVLDTTTPGEVNLIVTASDAAGSVHALPIFNLPGLLFMALLLAVSGVVRLRMHRRV